MSGGDVSAGTTLVRPQQRVHLLFLPICVDFDLFRFQIRHDPPLLVNRNELGNHSSRGDAKNGWSLLCLPGQSDTSAIRKTSRKDFFTPATLVNFILDCLFQRIERDSV